MPIHPRILLLISGLPGTGKSTLARAYVSRHGGEHINSDLVRAQLGLRGKYQPGAKERVYAAMLAETRAALETAKGPVVVDSTFYKAAIREPFEAVAAQLGLPIVRVLVGAGEAVIRARLQRPRPDSEADFGVYETIRDQYETWEKPQLELRSDEQSLDEMVAAVHHYVLQQL